MKVSQKILAFLLMVAVLLSGSSAIPAGHSADNTISYNSPAPEEASVVSVSDSSPSAVQTEQTIVSTLTSSDESNDFYPLIIVPGIAHSKTYVVDENYCNNADPSRPAIKKDKDGNDLIGETVIFDLPSALDSAKKNLILPLVKSILSQKDCGLSDAFGTFASDVFSVQQTLPDTSFANNKIDLLTFNGSFADYNLEDSENGYNFMQKQVDLLYRILPLRAISDVIGEENMYFFTFSLFGDAMQAADHLNAYIQMVKEKNHCDKVNLLPISLGGTVFTAYCEKYTDANDVNSIVNIVPVLNGTQAVTDLYNRDFNLDDDFIYHEFFPMNTAEWLESGETVGHLVNLLIRILPKEVCANILTKVYDAIFENILRNTPQFWTMITREAYPALADRYLNDEAHKICRQKTDAFYQAQCNLEDNITQMVADGVKINILSGYGLHTGDKRYTAFKITGNAEYVNSDGVIHVASTTLGANAALPGTAFADTYKQAYTNPDYPDYSYISPDRSVDVSSGILPDNTWMFSDMHHEEAANNAPVINLGIALMYGNEITDVHSNPSKYPQFNGTSDNFYLRRWRYNELKRVNASCHQGEIDLTDTEYAHLQSLLQDCEAVMTATIADDTFCAQTTRNVNQFLAEHDGFEWEKVDIVRQNQLPEMSPGMKAIEKILSFIDTAVNGMLGGKGYSDILK